MELLRAFMKARPDAEFEGNQINAFSLDTIAETYIGDDFPSQAELDVAWIECQEDDERQGIVDQIDNSDKDFIRVMEDLFDTLVSKGVLTLLDLPQSVQDKINHRKNLRNQL